MACERRFGYALGVRAPPLSVARASILQPAGLHVDNGESPVGSGNNPYCDMNATTTSALLYIDGLADLLGVSERFVRRLVEERRIPFLKIGRHVRFEPAEVESWIRSSRIESARPFDIAAARRPVQHCRNR